MMHPSRKKTATEILDQARRIPSFDEAARRRASSTSSLLKRVLTDPDLQNQLSAAYEVVRQGHYAVSGHPPWAFLVAHILQKGSPRLARALYECCRTLLCGSPQEKALVARGFAAHPRIELKSLVRDLGLVSPHGGERA